MADSILRLKVESQEYDNKLKQATNGLTRYVDECRKVGGTLEVVEKETLDYVRALGQMDTTSRTATGKLAEMKKTFTEISAQYKQMTDAEKQSPFGKALAESLDELKPRIIDAKNQLDEINKSMIGVSSGGGGFFSGMGDKMSGAIQVFAGNMMTKAAGAVAELGSEIFASVQQGIELARQGEGIRIAFERLGRGDILDGLREATHGTVTDLELMKAAVKFNDFKLPLDELGTMLAFAQQKAKDTGQSVDYMVDSIVTGLGRKSLMILDNLGLSAAEIKEKMAETGDMTKAVGEIIREQMEKAGEYVETAADRSAKATADLQNAMMKLGETFGPITQNSDSLWNSIKIGAINALNYVGNLINYLHEAGRISKIIGNMNGGGMMERFGNNLRNSKDPSSLYQRQLAEINRSINSAEAKLQQAEKGGMGSIQIYRERVQALKEVKKQYQELYQTITRPAVSTTNIPAVVTPKTGGSSGNKKEFDISSIAFNQNKAMLAAEKGADGGPSEIWRSITQGARESTNSVNELTKAFEDLNRAKGDANVQGIANDGKVVKGSFSDAASSVGSLGAALAGLDDPAAKIAGVIAQSIANVALAFSNAQLKDGETGNVWYWIAAVASGAAAMISTIATIHSATGYAQGGIVKGNSYSGDNIYGGPDAMVNAGELVLTKAQQNTLAQNLQGGGNIRMTGEVTGEKIVLVANRYLKRTGQGEIVTW